MFTWKPWPEFSASWNSRYAGKLAGSRTPEGYWQIKLEGQTFLGHRLAWVHYHGEWPEGEVDHINHRKSDNRIENLRDVSHAENQRNRKNQPGVRFRPDRGKWIAEIWVEGRNVTLGNFHNKADAERARREAELKFW